MHQMYEAMRDCGWAGLLCVFLFLPGLVLGIVGLALASKKPRAGAFLGVVTIGLAVFVGVISIAGRQLDIMKVMGATAGAAVEQAQRERIRAEGIKEANECLEVGAVTGGLPLVLGALAAGIGFAARKRAKEKSASA